MLKVDGLWFGAWWARAAGIPIGQCTLTWRIQSQTFPWSWHNHTAGELWGERQWAVRQPCWQGGRALNVQIISPMKNNGKDIPDKPGISCTMCCQVSVENQNAYLYGDQPLKEWPYTKERDLTGSVQSCPTLCVPMNCSTPGLPVHHQLLESTQAHVHRVGDAIQPSHPLLSHSPPAPNPS